MNRKEKETRVAPGTVASLACCPGARVGEGEDGRRKGEGEGVLAGRQGDRVLG